MRWTAIFVGCCVMLSGCCSALRESVRAYGTEAAENVALIRLLVERCRDGDAEACDGALDALDLQAASADLLAKGEGDRR